MEDTPFPIIPVHVSDRIAYRRCRRKWSLNSRVRGNLTQRTGGTISEALWFGSGFHHAMEDWHGHRIYETLEQAFFSYVMATYPNHPSNVDGLITLANGMFAHYRSWVKRRNQFKTLWIDGKPMVEVDWEVPIPGYENVVARGTFDRIVQDAHGRVWILDYKTAQRFNTAKLPMDPQVTTYGWAFKELYGIDMEGMVYMQFMKNYPKPPKVIAGDRLSVNSKQLTSYEVYKRTLCEKYGKDGQMPAKKDIPIEEYQFCLSLLEHEQPDGDKFIRWDFVRRNHAHTQSELWKMCAEVKEMLDPELPLYNNPTKDCGWDCDFVSVCLAMDDGSDYEYIINEGFTKRIEMHGWKKNIPTLEAVKEGIVIREERLAAIAGEDEESNDDGITIVVEDTDD